MVPYTGYVPIKSSYTTLTSIDGIVYFMKHIESFKALDEKYVAFCILSDTLKVTCTTTSGKEFICDLANQPDTKPRYSNLTKTDIERYVENLVTNIVRSQ